jgi:hypothetical protein
MSRKETQRPRAQRRAAAREAAKRRASSEANGTRSAALSTEWLLNALAGTIGIVGFLVPELPLHTRVALLAGFLLTFAASRLPRARKWLTVGVAAVALGWLAVSASLRPSEAEATIESYYDVTSSAEIWSAGPTMSERSRAYMIEHFTAFDPGTWHAHSELPDRKPVPMLRAIREPDQYTGRPITVVGRLYYQNNLAEGLDLEWIIQLLPLDRREARTYLSAGVGRDAVGSGAGLSRLYSDAPVDAEREHVLMYARITLPPFRFPSARDVWVLTGAIVGTGYVLRSDGSQASTIYFAASSGTRYRAAELPKLSK